MMTNPNRRIAPVDGLRAFAALGVTWYHVWNSVGAPPTLLLGTWGPLRLDLQRALSLIGLGVDFFFVLSGFCLYVMYIGKQTTWSWAGYGDFIKRRWLRLAPAYYVAVICCAIGFWWTHTPLPWFDVVKHLAFVFTWGTSQSLCPPFWSLCTEWHFYLLLPGILWAARRWGFGRVLMALMVGCMAFRVYVYIHPPLIKKFWGQLPLMLVEFGWGILVARFMEQRRLPPVVLQGNGGFLIGLFVTLAGRILTSEALNQLAGGTHTLLYIVGQPVATLGFAMMLWNVISGPSYFERLLSHSYAQALGRWSYSIYLWHWWPALCITEWMIGRWGATFLVQYAAFALVLAVVIPFSWLSYTCFEAPYFNRWRLVERAAP